MALTVGDAIDAVLDQGGFDSSASNSSRAAVCSWLDAKHKEMVRKAKYRRESVEIGPTVADQAAYTLDSSVLAVDALAVNSVPYNRKGRRQLQRLQGGIERILFGFVEGFFVPTFDASGALSITLYPTPSTADLTITGDCVVAADTLTTSDEAAELLVADEFAWGVVDGAIGVGHLRVSLRPDLAAPFEQSFLVKTEEARKFIVAQVGGTSPTQLRVLR